MSKRRPASWMYILWPLIVVSFAGLTVIFIYLLHQSTATVVNDTNSSLTLKSCNDTSDLYPLGPGEKTDISWGRQPNTTCSVYGEDDDAPIGTITLNKGTQVPLSTLKPGN